jgi:hypothetical protein
MRLGGGSNSASAAVAANPLPHFACPPPDYRWRGKRNTQPLCLSSLNQATNIARLHRPPYHPLQQDHA